MIVEISLAVGVPSFRQRTVLDGREYVLDCRWSQRADRWYLDVRNSSGALLAGGIKLVVNFPLLFSRRSAALPPGELLVVDTRETPADPGLADLGGVVGLCYVEEGTVIA